MAKPNDDLVSFLNPKVANRLKVNLKTGKLYWDENEIIARRTIDFSKISVWWKVFAGLVAAFAGIGTMLDAMVSLNKETCWVKIGDCVKKPPPPVSTPDILPKSAIYFYSDKSVLKAESDTFLNQVTQILSANPKVRLQIRAYTDNAGSAGHNLKLSEDRAASVAQGLYSRGIAADRISSIGYGAANPIADNGTAEGRAKNRRVELVRLQ